MTYRLLVVAGENAVLRALPEQLGSSVSVKILDDANDALWEVRSDPPEAVIADVHLSGMSGIELAEIIPNFDVPTRVLLWSADPADPARHQAAELGVYRFLDSQSSLDDLHRALHDAMSDAQAAQTSSGEAAQVAEPELEPAPAPEPTRREFTPARVVLPSRAEQEAAAREARDKEAREKEAREKETARPHRPEPSSRSGGLASRATKAAVAERSAPRSEAPKSDAPASRARPQTTSSGTMVITEDRLGDIRQVMGQLAQDLGAQAIMLTDRAGMVLADVGNTDGMPMMMIVLPLLSTAFSTVGEVARQLRDDDATTLYIHDGTNYDLYCFDVAGRHLLVLVFNKKVVSSKIGSVWISAKRAVRELRDVLG
jgi:DNA-binding NarL/FixJ family response regulator